MDKVERRFWKKVAIPNGEGCRNWMGFRNEKGYGVIRFQGRQTRAHRVAYLFTKGEIPEGMIVMHTCDNPACCNPDHLRAGTQADNLADMRAKDREGDCRNFGKAHGMCKLTSAQVARMRKLYAFTDISQRALAQKFGIGRSHAHRIVSGVARLYG